MSKSTKKNTGGKTLDKGERDETFQNASDKASFVSF